MSERAGLTLIEILVASVILVVVAIPMLGIFDSSRQSIARTDRRREIRHITSEILAHAGRQPLHDLWDQYGPGEVVGFDTAGRMHHKLADLDPATGHINGDNPLGFNQAFLDEMRALSLEARLYFEFYTRVELGLDAPKDAKEKEALSIVEGDDPVQDKKAAKRASDLGLPPPSSKPAFGILHMQAGYARVDIFDRDLLAKNRNHPERALVSRWAQPIMCPAVVGRPGLKLASCPAVNAKVKAKYLPLLAMREGF